MLTMPPPPSLADAGVWTKDMKIKTNLAQPQIAKIIKVWGQQLWGGRALAPRHRRRRPAILTTRTPTPDPAHCACRPARLWRAAP